MKLKEAKEIVGFYENIFRESPEMLSDVVGWKIVKEKLKKAIAVLDDPALIQKTEQLIKEGDIRNKDLKQSLPKAPKS